MRQVSHDPFSRWTFYSEVVYTSETCKNCGCVKTSKHGKKYLYRFYSQADGIYTRKNPLRGLFCGRECMDAYHGN